ncbi:putative pentatricopeptide repeat-containing protein At5g08310, mitochondrial isoform X1 [Ziziphus jujuba]|uniref:Pentatricopeptide repeat-containing protein At5g08310, mitochondrial isoform X1 n=1 Tax=Ziziphus jujuba TaxID=326968 RepID=A0ABM3IQG9_ZIZJJ|nr:putative pentatricopeptide repeat-containing protein At5g08310, mitochondrial isoform X1 [Ziziphus jujuba]XP_048333439.2 putative pentatricopeptide repeat-containing protein At5g08310, mitochondrial isoform X1 [Ziziphus jujuba]XP_048333440.2 putative pentatricopeptide repeat-containing protein At5g08310, mitochondrial isoform X1 [Ziziphus jujuba]XP_048333441.2 putative pentatricopeptide repeat-containing protein At5g08310, mitochondrial isoform X1 [Ziziphus jujuba]XP_048333442.2 putative pen
MTLSSISKAHLIICRTIKFVDPNGFLLLILTKNRSPTSRSFRSFCSNNTSGLSLGTDLQNAANGFISIFTKQPFSPDNPELKNLTPVLNTKVVETVLNGLKSWRIAQIFFTWASNQYGYKHNCYTYNAMASILSRAQQNAPLRALALDIVDSHCLMSPGALGFFIRCLGSVGLVGEANFLFDQVRIEGLCVPNSYSYTCLLEALSKSNSIDLFEMRLKEIRDFGWESDKYVLTPTLKVYCNVGKFEKALDVFNEMYERGWADAHSFNILILSFSKWGEVDRACELIERMVDQNIEMNEKTFHVLIHGFVRESRVDKALELFDKMKKLGFALDVSLYDVLIGGLCKNNDLDKALYLYSEMKELGIQPDFGILTKLISSCSDEGKMIQILEETRKEIDKEAVVLLYNSVLNGLVSKGSVDKAYQLLQSMMGNESNASFDVGKLLKVEERVHPVTTSFRIVIDGLLKNGNLDMALILFEEMSRIGCKPDIVIYNNVIDGLCNANRLEESYKLLGEMAELGLEPTHFTHNSIYGCLCRRGDVVGALGLVKKMRSWGHQPWIKHSTLLVKLLCNHGKVVEACNFLCNMVDEGFLPDIVAYSAAIDGLIKFQEIDSALHMFRDICAHGYIPDVVAYNTLIKGLCKTKRISEAQDCLNEMMMKGLVPSVVTYNLLIDGCCKTGDVDQAMSFLSRMFCEEREPNVITYTTLIDGLCTAGRSTDALMLWNSMSSKGCAPNRISFMSLINGLCKCGMPDTALVYLRNMEQNGMKPDIYVYVALLSAFLSDLNLPSAFEVLNEMADKGIIPDPLDKKHSIVRDAISKLLEDDRTSSSVKSLIANGSIPTITCSDSGSKG